MPGSRYVAELRNFNMNETSKTNSLLGEALLREEPPNPTEYKEYRMKLELALNRAERWERMTFHVCWISMLSAIGLSFVGASRIFGSFDPYDSSATLLSVVLAVIYVLACIAFPLSLASLYSRFRPRVSRARQALADAKIDQLQREVEALREGRGE